MSHVLTHSHHALNMFQVNFEMPLAERRGSGERERELVERAQNYIFSLHSAAQKHLYGEWRVTGCRKPHPASMHLAMQDSNPQCSTGSSSLHSRKSVAQNCKLPQAIAFPVGRTTLAFWPHLSQSVHEVGSPSFCTCYCSTLPPHLSVLTKGVYPQSILYY